jgi:IstB-like ATP binding protein
LVDGKPIDPPAVKPPNALTLTTEPQANVERYDALRKAREARHAYPAAGAVVIMLRTLKMHGMAQAVGELTEQGSPAFEAAVPILSQLLKAETADREVRSTAYQLKAARFPNYRDLAGFDFASSEVNEALARQLHRCEFLEDAHNVVLVGGPEPDS